MGRQTKMDPACQAPFQSLPQLVMATKNSFCFLAMLEGIDPQQSVSHHPPSIETSVANKVLGMRNIGVKSGRNTKTVQRLWTLMSEGGFSHLIEDR